MAKLWDKGYDEDARIDAFTVGNDRQLDLELAPYDILGTMAHITMLQSVGLLSKEDLDTLLPELKALYAKAEAGEFVIEEDVEDVHSQVELMLTRKLGDVGKKVHTGRSRNQVLVDLKLFTRARIEKTVHKVESLFKTLQEASEKYKDDLIPGYTHLQVAMPSSFGLWFGAYAESLCDDLEMMKAAWNTVNRNPLGSAAGYGSSAPIDRTLTTKLLGFDDLDYNSVYAQMTRGKMERAVAFAYSSIAETVGKLAYDGCLYSSQNFGFIKLPDALTTGSSIMPHKKNPDVWEILRGKCNRILACENEIALLCSNMIHGYHRDWQLLKDILFPALEDLHACLQMTDYMLAHIEVRTDILDNPLYDYLFTVEEVNRRTLAGVPFRDAYRQVGIEVNEGRFRYSGGETKDLKASDLGHTHLGSLGNLCNDKIAALMDAASNWK